MPLLTRDEYLATCGQPMARVQEDESPPLDFWNYFDGIPKTDFAGHDCSEGRVDYAWVEPNGRFQHVLVKSENKNVFMVLVLDCPARTVYGHRLLDLNSEYGLELPNR
jgi:hypothetical protein